MSRIMSATFLGQTTNLGRGIRLRY